MKIKIYIPALYHYKFKFIAIILIISLIVVALFTRLFLGFELVDSVLIKWGILLAQSILLFSKEKHETIRIKRIRLIAQSYTIQFLLGFTLGYHIVLFFFGLTDILSSLDLLLMGCTLNVVLFYSIKWFGSQEIELEYKTITQIIHEYPLLFSVWIIMSVLTLLIIMFFI